MAEAEAEAAATFVAVEVGAAVVLIREVTIPLLELMLPEVELADELPDDEEEDMEAELEDEFEAVIEAEADEADALRDAEVEPDTARFALPPPIVPTVVHAEVAPAG